MLIQAEAGSCEKRSYNETTLEYRDSQRGEHPYPYPYGFVIGTRAADGDCVDCYLITRHALMPGSIVECEAVGLLHQSENEELDHKILATLPGHEVVLGPELLHELENFIGAVFSAYPDVRVRIGPILPREAALQHIQEARQR